MFQELVQVYALRAREFSDEVARLGQHERIGPAFLEVMGEIRRRQALCNAAGDELERYLSRKGDSASIP